MEKIKIPTSFNIELDFEVANLMQRFAAWLIDLVVQIVYTLVLYKFLVSNLSFSKDIVSLISEIVVYLPILMYHLLSEIIMNGQSLGKKLLGIKVISETGNRPSFYQYLLRWLIRPFDVTSLGMGFLAISAASGKNDWLFVLLYLVILVTAIVVLIKKHKRLGDLAAGTLVIISRVKTDINDTVFFELEEAYQPRYQNVLRLSDRDMNIIKTILDTSVKQKNYELAERTSAKIRTALQITEYQHPVEFLETVLKDYNYLSNKN